MWVPSPVSIDKLPALPKKGNKKCPSPIKKGVLNGPKSVLRSPMWTKKVFSRPHVDQYRCSSWTKGVAVAVLRGPSWPSVDKRCCRCRSSCPFVALRGQKVLPLPFSAALRGPPWTKGVAVAVVRGPSWPFVDKRCCRCRSWRPFVPLRGQKGVAVAVLRGPSWTKGVAVAVLRGPSCPFVDKRCCRACPQDTPMQPLATVDILYNLL